MATEGFEMTETKADHIAGLIADCWGCGWTRLRVAIESSWTAETSASPDEWSIDNPSLGQCAVTALVVHDAYGGELVRTTVGGVSHYFNRLPSGVEIDLTRDQFDEWDPAPFETRERAYVDGFPATAKRYAALSAAVSERLSA